jgi:hypothetical protein
VLDDFSRGWRLLVKRLKVNQEEELFEGLEVNEEEEEEGTLRPAPFAVVD